MMTVHEVSRLAGVSIRALQYYDRIGLLRPAGYTEAGYRLYDEAALEKLQQIRLFRELGFPLKDIREMTESPDFDREKALAQQIALLELKRERLGAIIELARGLMERKENTVDFKPFDTKKIEEYARQAKASWGGTPEYAEYEKKTSGRTAAGMQDAAAGLMKIFCEFSAVKDLPPASDEAQALVVKLRDYITANYYTCSDEVLASLGQMYGAGGEFTENIDAAAGEGTAEFAAKAIACRTGRNA